MLGQGWERVWGRVVAKGSMFLCGHAKFAVPVLLDQVEKACGKMIVEYSGLQRTGLEVCRKVASDLIGFHVIPCI